jgi:hypothetical protein
LLEAAVPSPNVGTAQSHKRIEKQAAAISQYNVSR